MTGIQLPNWGDVFVPDGSLLESFLRGTVVYLSILVLFRIVLKRQGGSVGLPDVMLVVLVSECVSASLSAETKSIPNGLVAVSALLFWSYTLDRLSHHWPWLERLLEPRPLQLVRDGEMLRENMAAEGITEDELKTQVRLNGVENVAQVKAAFIESEGAISVIPKDKAAPASTRLITPDFEQLTQQFVEAAQELEDAIAWHDQQAAEHQATAKAAREVLVRHGIRPGRSPARSSRREAKRTESAVPPAAAAETRS